MTAPETTIHKRLGTARERMAGARAGAAWRAELLAAHLLRHRHADRQTAADKAATKKTPPAA